MFDHLTSAHCLTASYCFTYIYDWFWNADKDTKISCMKLIEFHSLGMCLADLSKLFEKFESFVMCVCATVFRCDR